MQITPMENIRLALGAVWTHRFRSLLTVLGIVIGITGDFDITRHLSVIGEVSGHYVFFDDVSIFAMANLGLAVHF